MPERLPAVLDSCVHARRRFVMRAILALLPVLPVFAGEVPRLPMKPRFEDGAMYRWLQKPVLETWLHDDMENPSTWVHSGFGQMTFTREHAIDGQQSLRLQGKLELTSGYNSKSITATRPFSGEDWSKFNRLSFWVYPNLPGFHNISMQISLHNDGAYKVPAMWNREGFNTFELVNGKWNHIVWEIANLAHDKVTSLVIEYLNDGWEPQAERTVTFDLTHLELQRVDADHFEGWDVASGRISFSGSGYATGAPNRRWRAAWRRASSAWCGKTRVKSYSRKPYATCRRTWAGSRYWTSPRSTPQDCMCLGQETNRRRRLPSATTYGAQPSSRPLTFFIPSVAGRRFPACMGSAPLTGRECTATSASSSTVGGTTRGTFRKCCSTPARRCTPC